MKSNLNIFLKIFLIQLLACSSIYGQIDSIKFQTDEIIVTGTRVEQKIIDIPYSVQRIDKTTWQSGRKQGLNDVMTTVPGLFLQSRYGNHDVRISIRGFGSRSNSGIRGVRILLDGIPESEPDGQTRIEAIDFTAIGKIELVKGNSSSLYTNSPGGVINFLTDKYFSRNFVLSANEFGQYDLRKNDIKAGIESKTSRFMITGGYENYRGYRVHSQEYQSRLNAIYEANVTNKSKISFYGYYVNGLIKLPGSLTLAQYTTNDTMANPRDISRDSKRITKKGRLGITYNINFGKEDNNLIEVTGYGTIKDLERTAATYRIFNRYGLGSSFRYVNRLKVIDRLNEFSIGGDVYYQTGPVSEFDNLGGQKGDLLQNLNNETISNVGFYFTDNFPIITNRLLFLITGRYDRVNISSQNLQGKFQDTTRLFDKFTPKFALNLKLTRSIALYSSFGLGFDSPAFNEMDNYPFSSDGGLHLINPDLQAQKSTNFEGGIKGDLPSIKNKFLLNSFAELTFFHSKINDAIVPFTVDGTVYYRNAAVVKRTGLEFGLSTDIIKGLNLKTAYTYSDFKYDSYDSWNIDGSGNITSTNYSGKIEPSNPKHLLSIDLSYQHTFSKKYTFFVKANTQHIGEMYVDDFNTENLKTKSYNLLNGQIGFNFLFNNINIMLYGGLNNITNESYVAFIQINSDRGEYYESGARRNFFSGLTIGYVFNK